MAELGQLESRHQDFESLNVRVVATSLDGLGDSAQTQQKFPHLVILSDEKEGLARAAGTLAPQHSESGGDTNAPTTVLIDRHGEVRRVRRPDRFLERFSPDEVLKMVDESLPASR
jgi:peroxiredoxin